MTSIYDVLKASKGIHVDDTFAELWGRKLSNAYTVATYTGTLPATLQTVEGYLESYKIYGNTEQTGTPTPENPITPSECGERTGNVMPAGEQKTVVSNGVTFSSDGNGRYHISGTATTDASACFNLLSAFTTPISISSGGQGTLSFFNTQSNINVNFIFYNDTTGLDSWRMTKINRTSTTYNAIGNKDINNVCITINSGETVDMTIMPEFTNDGVLPSEFEPYGYKLPILSNSTVTNIYLGEVETTRKIKKLVLTGEEPWNLQSINSHGISNLYTQLPKRFNSTTVGLSSHFNIQTTLIADTTTEGFFISAGGNVGVLYIRIYATRARTVEDFKSYLAAQYAAGTPVIIWYVLAEPETAVVNEPLMKIDNYVDTVSMEQAGVSIPTVAGKTTISWAGSGLAPSEVELTYRKRKGQ